MSTAFTWTDTEVRQALGLEAGNGALVDFSGVTTDSRKVRPDDLYVALIGEKFDGHEFVDAAVAGGATGTLLSPFCVDHVIATRRNGSGDAF